MSEHESGLTPEERKVREAVRELDEVRADPAFAARLREGFTSGRIAGVPDDAAAEGDAAEGDAASEGGAEDGAPRVVLFPARRRVIALAVAAAVAGLFLIFNQGPSWELAGTSGSGRVIVGGTDLGASETEALRELIHPGASVRLTGDAQLDLTCSGRVAMQITPGSDVTIPGASRRWLGRSMRCTLREGEIRVSTGPDFPGSKLIIEAPAASVEVLGTTLAVIANPCTTCVCVFEGEVDMIEADDAHTVSAGMRRTVFTNGREPIEEEILPMERMKLEMLRDQAGTRLRVR